MSAMLPRSLRAVTARHLAVWPATAQSLHPKGKVNRALPGDSHGVKWEVTAVVHLCLLCSYHSKSKHIHTRDGSLKIIGVMEI